MEQKSDRLTYWESRQINIGDFDNRQFGISYAKEINLVDKTINIRAKRESSKDELEDSIQFVTETLNRLEAEIREKTDGYVKHDSIIKISDDELKDAAIDRRNGRKEKINEASQNFKDRVRRSRSRNFLDE